MKILIIDENGAVKASRNIKDVDAGVAWALKKGAAKMRFLYDEAKSEQDLAQHIRTGPPQSMLRK